MRDRLKKFAPLLILGFVLFFFAKGDDCSGDSSGDKARATSVAARNTNFDRASKAAPLPRPVNFPQRKALVEYTERQDLINHPWYIYKYGMDGNVIGYYVGKTYPISTCNFLSSTQDVRDDDQGNLVLAAPSLDGMFYGGSGATGGCGWFFFDYTTNAMITMSDKMLWDASDIPFIIDAEPIKVATAP